MQYGPLLIFIAAVLWGIDGVLRRSLYSLPPSTIVFYEHLIGLVIIAPLLWRAWKTERLSRREWLVLGAVALFSGVLGTIFFTTALLQTQYIPFSVVFLIQKLQPIFAISMAAVWLRERITKRFLAWAALALVAGYFVTFPGGVVNMGAGGAYVNAALLALLAAACWGASTPLSRSLLLKHSNSFVTGMRFAATAALSLVFVFALGNTSSLSTISLHQILILVAIAFSTGLAALWIYYRGLKRTSASISAIVELAYPVTAVFIDYVLYGTVLAWSQYVATLVLFFAMYRIARESTSSQGAGVQ